MTLKVKPGDDIRWAGTISRADVTNFTGFTLTSQIRHRSATPGVAAPLLADATITWLDAPAGLFLFEVPRATTATWPIGALVLDVRVASPDGKWIRTETAEFMTEAGVTASP